MTWQLLRDAWLPYVGPRAEERARNAAAALMDDEHSDAELCAYLRANLEVLNRDDYRRSNGRGTVAGEWPAVSTETIAAAVADAMRALRRGRRAA